MINPVNNVTQTEYQTQTNRTKPIDSGDHFSLDSAIDKNNDQGGVIYERSTQKEDASNKEPAPTPKKDSFESTLEVAIATRAEREKEKPDELSVAMYAFFDKLQNFFVSLFKNIKTIFGNFWDSKPINEGISVTTENNNANDKKKNTSLDNNDYSDSSIASSENIEESDLQNVYVSSIDALEAKRDKDIRQALQDGDKEKFRELISDGGSRVPAHSTTAITTYNSRGAIVNINPSDENKILHGDRGVTKL